jgi:hypothetical protein
MRAKGRWQTTFLNRFSDREDIGHEGAVKTFWSDLPRDAVLELFQLVELEYGLAGGLLRPNDPITKLADPIRGSGLRSWLFLEARLEDAYLEVGYQLGRRLDRYGTRHQWEGIETIDHLVRAWCGAPRLGNRIPGEA